MTRTTFFLVAVLTACSSGSSNPTGDTMPTGGTTPGGTGVTTGGPTGATTGASTGATTGATTGTPTGSGGTASDPLCEAVWDVPFRSVDSWPCYGGTGMCFACARISEDSSAYARDDYVSYAMDPVSCTAGVFEQLGAPMAWYDGKTGVLTVSSYGGDHVAAAPGECDWL